MKTSLFDFVNEHGLSFFESERKNLILTDGVSIVEFTKNETYDEFDKFKRQATDRNDIFLESYCIYSNVCDGERSIYYPNEIFILK